MNSKPRAGRTAGTAAVLAAVAVLGGCGTSQNIQKIDRLESVSGSPRVILMPPDIRYYLLTAGGVAEPHAEWTEAAQANFTAAVGSYAASIGTDLQIVDPDNLGATHIEYEKLHSVVGMTVLHHQFGMFTLPSKGNGQVFDWSLGPGVRALGEEHDADYALFVFYRDYQASSGRVALVLLAAAAGVGTNTGSEGGFASLVDLRTGDIVWFNVVNVGAGELRDMDGALVAVDTLFRDIPTGRSIGETP